MVRLSCIFFLAMGLGGAGCCCIATKLIWFGVGLEGGVQVVAIEGMLGIFPTLIVGLEGEGGVLVLLNIISGEADISAFSCAKLL